MFIDPDRLQYDEVWGGAWRWSDMFPITPNGLVRASSGVVADLKRDQLASLLLIRLGVICALDP